MSNSETNLIGRYCTVVKDLPGEFCNQTTLNYYLVLVVLNTWQCYNNQCKASFSIISCHVIACIYLLVTACFSPCQQT
jgi:hypothetical protein